MFLLVSSMFSSLGQSFILLLNYSYFGLGFGCFFFQRNLNLAFKFLTYSSWRINGEKVLHQLFLQQAFRNQSGHSPFVTGLAKSVTLHACLHPTCHIINKL